MSAEEADKTETNDFIQWKTSILMYAEAAGYTNLSDNLVTLLAEDVVYRLQDVIQQSYEYMRNSKRRKLTTADFNLALRDSDIPPILGHNGTDAVRYIQTTEGELVIPEEREINLVSLSASSVSPPDAGQAVVKAQWLAIEGSAVAGNLFEEKTKGELLSLSDDLLHYYEMVTKAILDVNEEVTKVALSSLRTNSYMSPLLRYFVSFIANGVKTVSHDISQLSRLLHTVHSLVSNSSLYLEPYLGLLVQSVLYCITEPLAASINPLNDHWRLRDYASRLLAQIIRQWDNSMNRLRQQNIAVLQDVLSNNSLALCSHYGALMGLLSLGVEAVEEAVLPHFADYVHHLVDVMSDTSPARHTIRLDAFMVFGALRQCSELVYRDYVVLTQERANQRECGSARHKHSDELETSKRPSTTVFHLINCLYKDFSEHFADSLTDRFLLFGRQAAPPKQSDQKYARLIDPDSVKTGAELLKQFITDEPSRLTNRSANKNGDEDRSEKSARSSRSSRSDENLSFIGEDSDLTVKETVTDPSKGIKLTILKRPKSRVSPEPEPPRTDKRSVASPRKRRRQERCRPSDVFERVPFCQRKVMFVFQFQGRVQKSTFSQQQKLSSSEKTELKHQLVASKYRSLALKARSFGSRHFTKHGMSSDKRRSMCFNINISL